MSTPSTKSLAVLTSGGDAQGMNAAVRAVVRTALDRDVPVYAIYEGYQGMVDGGERIRRMQWEDVSGMLNRGGTIIGSARCPAFRKREGRLQAARNLLARGIDRLIVIGGDGSLTGANLFRQEWPELLAELRERGDIDDQTLQDHSFLAIVGLVGSIDNDMFGTDMTIGADSALHRITEAVDAISSTAASHQRSFVVEVMGRNCGYLALMSGLAGAADWVFIPEFPPETDNWEDEMCAALQAGREAGRRDNIVVVAEGARDRHGKPIESGYIKQLLVDRLGQDVRVTILGHVQRGGAPSAFDRYMSTVLGHAAVEEILTTTPESVPCLIGMRGNRITRSPLMECVQQTHAVADTIAAGDYAKAMELRGGSFTESFRTLCVLTQALPREPAPDQRRFKLAVINAGGPAPGMNTATRIAVRIGLDQGHIMLGVENGFQGLIEDQVREMDWNSVAGWVSMGGSELGTTRRIPSAGDFEAMARTLTRNGVQGLLVIGGLDAYETAHAVYEHWPQQPGLRMPIICLPASIDNNLPGSELSIGADTALNSIVEVVDKIKQSAVATRRVFVVQVMGGDCGYLALMSGLATGAERVYLPEEGVKLDDLRQDLELLIKGFEGGKRLGLLIRNEFANRTYDTPFMSALFKEEGHDQYDVRSAILGHLQQGGDPTPFDRIQASRLAARCVNFLIEKVDQGRAEAAFIGMQQGQVRIHDLANLPIMIEPRHKRPSDQWWLALRPIVQVLAQPGPSLNLE